MLGQETVRTGEKEGNRDEGESNGEVQSNQKETRRNRKG